MIKKILVATIILAFFSCNQEPDTGSSKQESNGDISFTLLEFSKKVENNNSLVRESFKNLDTAKYIELTKLYNTISYYTLRDSVYASFRRNYDNNYLMHIAEILGCEATVGLGFYCPKYELNIGGGLRFAPGTYFKIDSLHEKMEVH